ncbi:MAG: response regulator [Chloroflexi bacterium]|nr:response regulator [Chloroflexota bacterium]
MSKLKILIADDESIIRLGLKTMLAEMGHEVTMAVDGRDALKLAHQKRFDFAIFDIKMPFTDGLEAARALHRYRPTPTLILTAFGDKDLIEQAAELPIQGYLIKPVAEKQLAASIEVALRRFADSQAATAKAAELEETLETRKVVERAKGVLMKGGLTEEEAHQKLRKSARDKQLSLRQVAEAVLKEARK